MIMPQDYMIYEKGIIMKIFFGIDIGGTEIKFGMFTAKGELLDKWALPTESSGACIIPSIAQSITSFLSSRNLPKTSIAGIGMGIPGPVDKDGYVLKCVNLHWYHFNPVKELEKYFPDTCIVAGNDANVAAFGEYFKGAGETYRNMMLITLGTGVGGGIILDGKILLGAHGLSGEIGHITVVPEETEHCNCGNIGCIDQFASATGIVRIMKKLLAESSDVPAIFRKDLLDAKAICHYAKQGEPAALQCIAICMGALGKGMAHFTHAFDPDVFVIGGGVSKAGSVIIDPLKKAYNRHLFLVDKGADILTATLGNDAGIIGACMLAIKGLEKHEYYL